MAAHYPFSAGDAKAKTLLPAGACDCHVHVYDHRIPTVPGARLHPPDALIQDYQRVQARMGTRRTVLVTPSTYGADNSLLLDSLDQLGPDGCGVAVIAGDEPNARLLHLRDRGVRGVRINLSHGVIHDATSIESVAWRVASLGWHLQLLMPTTLLLSLAPVLRKLPVDLVFDHFARITPSECGKHPAHELVLDLLDSGRVWIKLSGAYLVSAACNIEDSELDVLARSYIDAAPDRVVWGSDWPHATASAGHQPMPDDARQIDRLAQWAGNGSCLQQILVTNPERLYGFSPTSNLESQP